ncbi:MULTISPECIES: hypothetical protein [Pectobacterium]|uniref:hypothetical protein n=1 Tax=Pectobacterium TaxID=122277 RepID=UPI0005823C22|nr:hypothetical protein [Pectobacterium carotovorum]KHS84240.1 hypothetical protein RC84_08180 [Pectobacterium carotovorum subsp. carotovorum]
MRDSVPINMASVSLAITIAFALCGGAYTLGKSDREDLIANLKQTVSGYEKVNDLSLQEILDKINTSSEKWAINITERNQLNAIKDRLKKKEEDLSKEVSARSREKLEHMNQLSLAKEKTLNIQKKYDEILPLAKDKFIRKKDVLHSSRSSIELIQDELYIGIDSVYSSHVSLLNNGNLSNLKPSETLEINNLVTNCYIRLKSIIYVSDKAVFDYGCQTKS